MFKIGNEVMDVNGNCYVVMGVGHATYELLDHTGSIHTDVLDVWVAKYIPKISEDLVYISESIHRIEIALNEVKAIQNSMFESVRRI